MEKIRLKICGLRDNITEVTALQPDYAGFIFYASSPRYVGEDFVMPELHELIKKVGVFVNEPVECVLEKVRKYRLDFAQFHGSESPEICEEIADAGFGVIKAFQMDDNFDFSQLQQYDATVDYFLFDTKTKSYGGSGTAFNWEILKKYNMEKPYFLSGGISLENLEGLNEVDLSQVHALDVNSKFELKPGLKNIEKLERLKDFIIYNLGDRAS
jgi:phosphoribosylanthranilate isomerase